MMTSIISIREKVDAYRSSSLIVEDDPFIAECNALSVEIESQIEITHTLIRDNYRSKFPELESLVPHPIDYARVVKKIRNETDLSLVDLQGLLPSATIMVVSITASTTTGKPLPEDVLEKTIEACDRALALDSAKQKVLDTIESRMSHIAPNLSAIVGSSVASKLMVAAGGLHSLAKTPSCNVQLLGADNSSNNNLAGFSTRLRVGYIEQAEIFHSTPPALRMRVCRLLASKSTLAARVDSTKGDPTGNTGRDLRQEILKKIDKWQEPQQPRLPKPLPVPFDSPRKKRGGRRLRKMKEKYAVTEKRKMANRVLFGVPEETSFGDGLGHGFGMLGQAGSGRLRVSASRSKLGVRVAEKFKGIRSYGRMSSCVASGLSSILGGFTSVQGLELLNPQDCAHQLGSGTHNSYFSETGSFSKFRRT